MVTFFMHSIDVAIWGIILLGIITAIPLIWKIGPALYVSGHASRRDKIKKSPSPLVDPPHSPVLIARHCYGPKPHMGIDGPETGV
jgi:hypothetical protein